MKLFYHLYCTGSGVAIFKRHMRFIVNSGLYKRLDKFYLGINFNHLPLLNNLKKKFLSKFEKIEIIFQRNTSNRRKPYKIPNEPRRCNFPLGESETILHMVKHAKSDDDCIYMFLHSKGASNPKLHWARGNQMRGTIKFQKERNLKIPTKDLNQRINFIIRYFIFNNSEFVENLSNKHYYYLLCNIFLVKSSLLKQFDWDTWFSKETLRRWKGQHYRRLSNRHVFANFPIKLYSQVKKQDVGRISWHSDTYK